MIDNARIDRRFLENANQAAARADRGDGSSTAAYMVKIEGATRTSHDELTKVGVGSTLNLSCHVEEHSWQSILTTKITLWKVTWKLKWRRTGSSRTAYDLFHDRVHEKTLAQYAEMCGVSQDSIVDMARRFTSYGKQAAAEVVPGAVQHTNGYYNGRAIILLNVLIGNSGWKGGLAQGGGHWHEFGGAPGNPYDFKEMHPAPHWDFGTKVNRERATYEESTLFAGYPS